MINVFRSQRGFSLIETLAAISVFAVMTVGVVPLIASSLRGSVLSRSLNFSKSLVQESMERIRGLPYYDAAAGRDVLDLYFPNVVAPAPSGGYDAGTKTFTTSCTRTSFAPASGAQACPPERASRIPAGYTITFAAQFVEPTTAVPQTYLEVAPPAGYDAISATASVPPAQLLRMTITASWTQMGGPRQFRLTSLIGNRKVSPDKVRAAANVDFAVQAHTAYKVDDPELRLSALTATAGRSTSEIEMRSFTSAFTETSAARQTLVRQQFDDELGTQQPGEILDSAVGAEATWRAPITVGETSASGDTVTHPDLPLPNEVARIVAPTKINENDSTLNLTGENLPPSTPVVQITGGLPKAASNFQFGVALGEESWWVTNQTDTSTTATLKLEPGSHLLSMFRLTGADRTRGYSYAEAFPIGASQKVHAIAFTRVSEIELFRSAITVPSSLEGDRGVLVIKNFQARVECETTDSVATSEVEGEWSADLRYWRDDTNDNVENGAYFPLAAEPPLAIGGSIGGGTDLASVLGNPLVIDGDGSIQPDVYLFEDPDSVPAKKGFLKRISTTATIDSFIGIVADPEGVETRVSMPYAINLVTARTDPLNEESELTVSLGKLNCRAVDRR